MSCRTLEFSKGRRREIVKIGGFRLGRQDERTKRKLGGTQQHDPMIIFADQCGRIAEFANGFIHVPCSSHLVTRSEEHTSELQSLMRLSSAVFCLNTKTLRHVDYTFTLQHLY